MFFCPFITGIIIIVTIITVKDRLASYIVESESHSCNPLPPDFSSTVLKCVLSVVGVLACVVVYDGEKGSVRLTAAVRAGPAPSVLVRQVSVPSDWRIGDDGSSTASCRFTGGSEHAATSMSLPPHEAKREQEGARFSSLAPNILEHLL